MDFIGREDELAFLSDHLGRKRAGLLVVYGRRRIGKTALLDRALRDQPRAAYHVGTRSTPTEELGRLSATLASAWDLPLLRAQPLGSSSALIALLESIDRPSTLVLDEFPYLVEGDPALPGLLQAAWDRKLSKLPLKIVLCGSSVSVMEELTLSPRAALYGRRTGQLRLGPLLPQHLEQAFRWPAPEIVELHALVGGVPGYLERLDPGIGLSENLDRYVLRRGEPLYEEVPFLLREELREPRVYHAILAAIAAGATKFGEISSKVGLDKANLTRYLAILAQLGLVRREVPILERLPDKSRKGVYRIADPFVATWFAIVHPFRDALERGRANLVRDSIAAALAARLPIAVEEPLRELFRGPLAHLVPFQPVHVGRQWSPAGEYDVVMLDETRRRAFVAEVKWSARPVGGGVLDQLRARIGQDPAFAGIACTVAAIARNGFQRRGPGLIDLRDVRLGSTPKHLLAD